MSYYVYVYVLAVDWGAGVMAGVSSFFKKRCKKFEPQSVLGEKFGGPGENRRAPRKILVALGGRSKRNFPRPNPKK